MDRRDFTYKFAFDLHNSCNAGDRSDSYYFQACVHAHTEWEKQKAEGTPKKQFFNSVRPDLQKATRQASKTSGRTFKRPKHEADWKDAKIDQLIQIGRLIMKGHLSYTACSRHAVSQFAGKFVGIMEKNPAGFVLICKALNQGKNWAEIGPIVEKQRLNCFPPAEREAETRRVLMDLIWKDACSLAKKMAGIGGDSTFGIKAPNGIFYYAIYSRITPHTDPIKILENKPPASLKWESSPFAVVKASTPERASELIHK